VFAAPKGRKERAVPLPDAVAVAKSEHLRALSVEADNAAVGRPRW
jgi:hypothetical protein